MSGKKLPINTNKYGSWQKVFDRYGDEAWPVIRNSFKIEPNARIFAIGSCFAVNIAKYLSILGYDVPSYRPDLYMNRHNPAQIYEELVFAKENYLKGGFDPETAEIFCINTDGGECYELDRPHFMLIDKNEFIKRRKELYDIFSAAFTADYAIITLGMIESWYYTVNKVHLARMPLNLGQKYGWDDFKVERLTFAESYDFVRSTIEIIRELNPDCKVLITTSPIPMSRTFTDNDIIIANNHSKSVLRAVCGEISQNIAGVDYFPSYEICTLSKGQGVWEDDKQHVTSAFVGKIVRHVMKSYCPDIPQDKVNLCFAHVAFKEKRFEDVVLLLKDSDDIEAQFLGARAFIMLGERQGAAECLISAFKAEKSDGCATEDSAESYTDICGNALLMLESGIGDAEEYFLKHLNRYRTIINEPEKIGGGELSVLLGYMEANRDMERFSDLIKLIENGLHVLEKFRAVFFGSSILCLNSGIFTHLKKRPAETEAILSEFDSYGSDMFGFCGETEENATVRLRSFLPQDTVRRLFLDCLFKGSVNVLYDGGTEGICLLGADGRKRPEFFAVFGTGRAGDFAHDELKASGINPVCFIDDFSKEETHKGLPVLTREDFAVKYPDTDTTAVVKGPEQRGDFAGILGGYIFVDMNRLSEFDRMLFGGRFIKMP